MDGRIITAASAFGFGALAAIATSAVVAGENARRLNAEHAERLLARYDANRDGAIDREEAIAARVRRITRADADGDGVLTLGEFRQEAVRRAELRAARVFARLDGDADGVVDKADVATYRAGRGARRVDRIFRRFDADGNDRITRAEIAGETD